WRSCWVAAVEKDSESDPFKEFSKHQRSRNFISAGNMAATRALVAVLISVSCFFTSSAQKTECTQEAVADIVFLVDGSWSIGTKNFQQVLAFLASLVDSFDVGPDQVRIGLVQYSTSPVTEFFLNAYTDKQEILQHIQNLPYRGGGTKIGLSLEFMLAQHFVEQSGSRANEGVPQLAVVITDGQSQDSVKQQAEMVKRRGITLYAIGIKDAVLEELQEIASDPDDKHVYSVSDFAALQGISQSVIQVLCTTVEEAKRQIAHVSQECTKATMADIVFLVDGSSTIGLDNFQEIRLFLHDFVDGLDIGIHKVRVGLAQFSNEPHQEFLLREHTEKTVLLERIDNLEYRLGGTETGKALQFLQSTYFTEAGGSRASEHVPQIAVVITDGSSTDDVQAPARQLRKQGVIIFAIGIGKADKAELQEIANSPHNHFLISIESYQALQKLTESLLRTVCTSVETHIQAPRFADVFILVDSTTQTEIGKVKTLLNRLVNLLNVGSEAHRIGLAQFGSDTKVEFLLNRYRTKDEVLLHLKNQFRLRPGRDRQSGRALEHARVNFFNTAAGSRIAEGFRQVLVVITAGQSQDSVIRPARTMKTEGITVISIGLAKTNRQELQFIATSPYVFQTSTQSITSIPQDVKGVIEYKEAHLGLATGPSDCRSVKVADIVFIVDQSGSMQSRNFQLVRKFIHSIVDGLDVSLKKVRVGIVLYGDTPKAVAYLNSINEKDDILQFINILPYEEGSTKTGAALTFTRENMFTKSAGSRKGQGVQQLAIVITNKKSQDDVSAATVALRRSGVTVYAVGVNSADHNELKQIASHPAREYVFKADSLTKLEKSLHKRLCYNIIQTAFSAPLRSFNLKTACVETEKADIYFLIDHSGSIDSVDFLDVKNFILDFLHMFKIGPNNVRVGVVKYSDSPTLEFDLTEHTSTTSLKEAVDNIINDGGGTETGKALSTMSPLFKDASKSRDEKVPEFLIIITDGKSTDAVNKPAKELRDQGVIIYAIRVSGSHKGEEKGAEEAELLEIAGSPKRKFLIFDFQSLKLIKDEVVRDICSTEVCKDMEGDVLFLIDGSTSINSSDFSHMKEFMLSIVNKSAIGLDKVHVGVLQFSTSPREEFPMNRFYDKGSINGAISSIPQLYGDTYTGKALSLASKYFDSPKGGRSNVRKFLIVITDGVAHDEVAKPAEELRNKGVNIYSIGILNANNSQLLEISGSQERVFSVREFKFLKHLEQTILFQLCHPEADCKRTKAADVIFLVDGSGSISTSQFQSMKKFMTSIVNNTDIGQNHTRFGTILYSDTPESNFTLNQYYTDSEVRRAIATLNQRGGNTYTARGLNYSLAFFEQQNGGRAAEKIPQVLIVITDGEATDPKDLPETSKAVREKGIKIIGVGVEGANKTQLGIMTGDPKMVLYVHSYEELEEIYRNISNALCDETKPVCDKETADLVILMDGSDSIKKEDFKTMKRFVSDLAGSFQVSQENVRIGMAQFSTVQQKNFYLNQYDNKMDVKEKIQAMNQIGGGTYIGQALSFIQGFFKASTGSRFAQKVSQNLVVITDGESQDEVEDASEELRSMNINVFVIGVGQLYSHQLLQIAGSPERLFTAENFAGLEKIKENVMDTTCNPHNPPETPRFADVFILVDSTTQTEIGKVKTLLNRLVNLLNVGSEAHRIGLAQFGSDTKVEFLLNRYRTKDEVLLHLKNQFRLRPGRDRQLGRALEHARVNFFNAAAGSRIAEGFLQVLVVITAGQSQDSVIRPARTMKTEGITVISIGLAKTNRQELQFIATSPYVFQTSTQSITSIPQDVKGVIEYKEAHLGLATGPSDCRSAKVADIVFIVDQSGSMQSRNFQLVLKFIHSIVDGLDVSLKKVRVGIVLYGDTPKAVAYLNSINEKDDILQFINILPYEEGSTKTGAALNFTRKDMFTKSAGSRKGQGVQQLAIVITNRKSQDDVSAATVALRRSGVTVYAVGVNSADHNELKQIASHPAREYVFKADSLTKLEKSLQKLLCYNIIQTAFSAPVRSFNLRTGCVETEKADIYFLIDQSGSIHSDDFPGVKNFIRDFLHMFKIGPNNVRVGVVKYSDSPTLEFDLTEHTSTTSLKEAVDNIINDGGGTETGKALSTMSPLFKDASKSRDEKVPEFLIIITDGKSTDAVNKSAKELRDQGVIIYAIGVNGSHKGEAKDVDEAQLLEMAGSPERKFLVFDFQHLKYIKDEVVRDICSTEVCKDMEGDVLFLIDGSSSIKRDEFSEMTKFMQSIVNKSAIGLDKVHVGVLQFSTSPREEFPMNRFYDQGSINGAISSILQLTGDTYTGDALSFASEYFDSPKGGRSKVRKFLIVITDGEAHDAVAKPAEELRNKGVNIYSIGILNANNSQLLEISGSQERVFSVREFKFLKHLEQTILFQLCHPEADCKRTKAADVIFLVDGSGSISTSQFQSMKKFMTSIVNNTDIGQNHTRFGTILYSDTPESTFTLNQYYTNSEVRRAIAALNQRGGNTYTARGLNYSLAFFEQQNGGRAAEKIPQVLIVITDGEATDPKDLPETSKAVREKGIKIIGVGVEGANKAQLEIMTGDPKMVLYVHSYEELEEIYRNISNVLCDETKPVCDKETGDLVILMDGSTSIEEEDFKKMKRFVSDLAGSFQVSQENVRIGMAQFSSVQEKIFYLNQYDNKMDVKEKIQATNQIGGGKDIGQALSFIQEFFKASTGSRIAQKVSQNLVVITDGESQDEVEHASKELKSMNINVFVIGVGRLYSHELLQIAGSPERFFTAENFAGLEKIKENVMDITCNPHNPPEICTVDIGIGFDISRRPRADLLFSGQQKLQAYLPEIIHYASSLDGLCCTEGKSIKPRIGFLVAGEDGRVINDYGFELYNEQVVKKVMALQTSETTFLNVKLLEAFSTKFKKQSRAGVKVLIIFTDGFDDIIEELEEESDRLRSKGIQALLLVGLERVRNPSDLQMVEFGRGFGYKQPLSIGMQNVASVMLKQIDTVAGRECCGVMCKCSGQEGVRGPRGRPSKKGLLGTKGHHGFPGEEGGVGERGPPGLNGTQGFQGCPGERGIMGPRGYRGNRGEDGDHGLDGVHGEQGVTGSAGAPGEREGPGSPGPTGIRGEAGVRGQSGLRGDPGAPGGENTVPGPRGEPGNPGMQGDSGEDGPPGENGIAGNRGPQGRRGPPGDKSEKGVPGELGLPGSAGPSGPQGGRGPRGLPGPIGTFGLPGPQGKPGPAGDEGLPGSRGFRGQKGQPGDLGGKGAVGPLGPRGMPGLDGRDGYGFSGSKGLKGEPGFPGYPGPQGKDGFSGENGGLGPKGNHGRRVRVRSPFLYNFRKEKGTQAGQVKQENLELQDHLDTRAPEDQLEPDQCRTECPAYPTELVIALDMSADVSPKIFERMRKVVLNLLEEVSIAESNCPTGARVAVLSYSSNTKYLIRFSDNLRKQDLMEAVNNIALERTSNRRNIGAAMRFVIRNVFKRTRQGVLMRKVAIFINNGPSQDINPITTAVLEFKALDITPAVLAFKNPPNIRRAFEADETRSFLLIVMRRPQDLLADLRQVQQCVICYDPCRPAEACRGINLVPVPQELDIDLALVVDSSRNVQSDQYEGMRQLLGSVLDQIVVSTQPGGRNNEARVALVQHSTSSYPPREGLVPVKVEFDLLGYKDRNKMKTHIFQQMQQIGGASGVGHAIEWTIRNIMLKASNPRKTKMVLAIVGGETSQWDKDKLGTIAQQAKCQGVVVFILTVGDEFNNAQVEELASLPLEQHIVHLAHMKWGEQEYAYRFLRSFLHMLKRGINKYPSTTLQRKCKNVQMLTGQVEGQAIDRFQVSGIPVLEEDEEAEYIDEEPQESKSPGRGDENGFSTRIVPAVFQGTEDVGQLSKVVCSLQQEDGDCQNYTLKWYFDMEHSKCSHFWYSGCGG
ncbi:hypothetical protein SKAU_G00218940, partial [Synaphobranchus kaupii]